MPALKFAGFTVGQVIRAQDFEPRQGVGECYIEGPILEVHPDGNNARHYAHYAIRITRDVFGGAQVEKGRMDDVGYVPMQCFFSDWDTRVTLAPLNEWEALGYLMATERGDM